MQGAPGGCLSNEQLGIEVEEEVWMGVGYCMRTQVEFKQDLDGLRATWE